MHIFFLAIVLSLCLGITGSDYPIGMLTFACLQSEKHGDCLKETGQQPKKQQQKTHKNTQKHKIPHRKLAIEQHKPNEKC
jgi:hypothetical protein